MGRNQPVVFKEDNEWRLWVYTLTLLAACIVLGITSGWSLPSTGIQVGLFFLVLNLISESFSVHLPFHTKAGTISVTSALVIAEILLFSPLSASLLAAVGTIRPKDVMGRTKIRSFIFNRSQIFFSTLITADLFKSIGGFVAFSGDALLKDAIPLVVAGVLFTGLNLLFMTIYIGMSVKKSPRSIWRTDLSFSWINHLADTAMALLLVGSYLALGFLGPVLFFSPLLFSRWSMARFVQLREVYMDIVGTLTKTLEAKDPYTAGHSARVADYAVDLGVALKVSNRDLDALYFAGMLHDIGKIAIPDEILNKVSVLSREEYAQMQQHAIYSFEIVQHLQFLGRGIEWIACHHERWDGKGFPGRVKGEEIPFGARIISVVDTFDAMTSDRSYRKGSSITDAEEEIGRVSGSQFDPKVVATFLRMSKSLILEEAGDEAAATSDTKA